MVLINLFKTQKYAIKSKRKEDLLNFFLYCNEIN